MAVEDGKIRSGKPTGKLTLHTVQLDAGPAQGGVKPLGFPSWRTASDSMERWVQKP